MTAVWQSQMMVGCGGNNMVVRCSTCWMGKINGVVNSEVCRNVSDQIGPCNVRLYAHSFFNSRLPSIIGNEAWWHNIGPVFGYACEIFFQAARHNVCNRLDETMIITDLKNTISATYEFAIAFFFPDKKFANSEHFLRSLSCTDMTKTIMRCNLTFWHAPLPHKGNLVKDAFRKIT